jgi:hypothetical protein
MRSEIANKLNLRSSTFVTLQALREVRESTIHLDNAQELSEATTARHDARDTAATLAYEVELVAQEARGATPEVVRAVLRYVDYLEGEQRLLAKAAPHFYINPGKRFVTTAVSDGKARKRGDRRTQEEPCEIRLKYSSRQRAYETKLFKRARHLKRLKIEEGILRLEHMHFKGTYSKSVSVETYAEYIKAWRRVSEGSCNFNRLTCHHQERLSAYIDTRRSTDNMLKRTADAFGAQTYGFCGDMSLPGGRGYK